MANANLQRDWRIYADFARLLIAQASALYQHEPFLELDQTVYAFDSTTVDLCLSLFPWAQFRRRKSAVTLHTLLDLRGNIPTNVYVIGGQVNAIITGRRYRALTTKTRKKVSRVPTWRMTGCCDWKHRCAGSLTNKMTLVFGNDWPKRRLPKDLYEKWEERKRNGRQADGKEWPLIAYADFTDYERVICKRDNWREVFGRFSTGQRACWSLSKDCIRSAWTPCMRAYRARR